MKKTTRKNNCVTLFRPLRKQKIKLFFICSLQIAAALLIPFLLSDLINTLSAANPAGVFLQKSLFLFLIVAVNFFLNWWQNASWHNYGYRAMILMQKACFDGLLKKPLSYFSENNSGDTLNKLLNDSSTYGQNEALASLMLFLNLFNIAGVLFFMFLLNAKLAVAVLVFLALYFLFYNRLNVRLRKSGKAEREAYSQVMQDAQEKLQGMETIRDYGCHAFFSAKFSATLKTYFERIKKLNFFTAAGISANSSFYNLLSLATIVIGCFFILNRQMQVGALVAFYAYLSYVCEPVRNLADFNLQRQKALAVKDRVLQILSDEGKDGETEKTPAEAIREISFRNVSFHYEGAVPILRNFSANLHAGDRVAVVGPSGTGKSTLLKLLLNRFRPEEGEITFNGAPADSLSGLNEKIAYLGQSPFLFEGTVLENLTFGRDSTAKKLSEALTLSAAELFCPPDEAGRAQVEPGGGNFSGGEKQRIALARAMLKNADVILLDEATSALDLQIEKQVVANLDRYLTRHPEKIMIAVTHRPEIRKICNRVIELRRPAPENSAS